MLKKSKRKKMIISGMVLLGIFCTMDIIVKRQTRVEKVNKNNTYLDTNENKTKKNNLERNICTCMQQNRINGLIYESHFYEKTIKPIIDKILSFGALTLLLPLYVFISLAIYIDDRGPIIFTQTRVGKDKHLFTMHKFRTMKMSAPHNIPTHMLENPELYITRVGRILRKTSLDELPQVWDIFCGNMSVIGPRPALYNQKDLIAEREKYNANSVMPGLTGLAQIKGRDELEISDKARIDGEYVRLLHSGNMAAFTQDIKCFVGTIGNVLTHKGIIEGGTGKKHLVRASEALCTIQRSDVGFEDYGYLKKFNIDREKKRKILVTGANSYIGESFKKYVKKNYLTFTVDIIDMTDNSWRNFDFSPYDTIFHVAGIAHADVAYVTDEEKQQYYAVNAELAVETAKKAKDSNVSQFIFMSSAIIYGDSAVRGEYKVIDEHTIPTPVNFYGHSKWCGDVGVRTLADENFHVAVLRCPMIYGKGSKGNYQVLSKLARILPIFPDIENERSILYIDNLCEFLCLLILSGEGGVYFPQNSKYARTSYIVERIAKEAGKKIYLSSIFNPFVRIGGGISKRTRQLANKAFGNLVYSQKISSYDGLDYRIVDLEKSIELTEKDKNKDDNIIFKVNESANSKKNVLIVASVASMIDQFNIPNIKLLKELGYNVDVACNFSNGNTCSEEKIEKLQELLDKLEVDCYQIDFDRNITDSRAVIRAFKQLNSVVEGTAIPRNIKRHHHITNKNKYRFMHSHSPIGGAIGRMVAKIHHIKTIYTAHGFHFYDGAPRKNWLLFYPIEKALSKITDVLIVINQEDYKRARKNFYSKRIVYVPGVGIDIKKFSGNCINPKKKRTELELRDSDIMLLSVGELIPRKNHEVIINALAEIGDKNIKYFIVGKGELEKKLVTLIKKLELRNQIYLLGFRTDIAELCQAADLFIFPSHQEGLPLALMEAIACKTPVICSDIRGNTDLVKETKCLFNENNISEVVGCLRYILKYKGDIRSKMQKQIDANYESLKDYDLKVVEKKMRAIYTLC